MSLPNETYCRARKPPEPGVSQLAEARNGKKSYRSQWGGGKSNLVCPLCWPNHTHVVSTGACQWLWWKIPHLVLRQKNSQEEPNISSSSLTSNTRPRDLAMSTPTTHDEHTNTSRLQLLTWVHQWSPEDIGSCLATRGQSWLKRTCLEQRKQKAGLPRLHPRGLCNKGISMEKNGRTCSSYTACLHGSHHRQVGGDWGTVWVPFF